MTSNLKWTKEFCDLYVKEGLDKTVKWGTLGDAPSVAVKPEIIEIMKNSGCAYISFGFESASDKVLNEDIGKGQLRVHLQKTVDTVRKAKMTPITTFMIGNMHENINDLMETVDFGFKMVPKLIHSFVHLMLEVQFFIITKIFCYSNMILN